MPLSAAAFAEQLSLVPRNESGDSASDDDIFINPEVCDTDLGPLDGPAAALRGDRFDFRTVGLEPTSELVDIARLLIAGPDMAGRCYADGCRNKEHRKGALWCEAHEPMPPCEDTGECAVDDCDQADGHGPWCKTHHARWYSTGNPLGAAAGKAPCRVNRCEEGWYRRGMCKQHHADAKAARSHRALTARQRRRIRRAAVVSCMSTGSDHDKLRAAARWAQTVRSLADEFAPGTAARTLWERERDEAMLAFFENGAAQLSIAQATKWNHPNAKSELDDLIQEALNGMGDMLLKYDPDGAPISAYAHRGVNDSLRQMVWKEEHPYLPRKAARNRGRIFRTFQKIANERQQAALADDSVVPAVETDPQVHEEISERLGGIRPDLVRDVLNPPKMHSYNAPVGEDGGTVDIGDWFIEDEGTTAHEAVEYGETMRVLGHEILRRLDDEEREVLSRYDGLGGLPEEDLATIGESLGRTRTWAASKRKKAIAKLRSPIAMSGILGLESDPSRLSDNRPGGTGNPFLDRLTERQQFVAQHVLGMGGNQIAGDTKQRIVTVAGMLEMHPVEVEHQMYEVLRARNGGLSLKGSASARAYRAAAAAADMSIRRARETYDSTVEATLSIKAARDEVARMPENDEQAVLLRGLRKVHKVANRAKNEARADLRTAVAALDACKDGNGCPIEAARVVTDAEGRIHDRRMRVAANASAVRTQMAKRVDRLNGTVIDAIGQAVAPLPRLAKR